jgi:plasmid stabilization system protein ParE
MFAPNSTRASAMTRIEVAPRARADLIDIEIYLKREAGERRAKAVLRRIRDRIDRLREFPELGVEREDYGGRRVLQCRPYIAIYRVRQIEADTLVIILRIVHGARDIPTLLEGA